MTPRPGTPEQFAALRSFLTESDYTETAICERLEIPSLSKVVHLRTGGPRADALDWLIRLFLLEETLPANWIPAETLALLRALGLVAGEADVTGTVKLYPVRSVYVISDRDLSRRADAEHVFSAISPQTEEFLQLMPETPCPACLEVCAGAGAAALLAAQKYAVQAFAFDVSERCRAFAEFSRRLNGLKNLTVKRGDMYAPSGGQTFDRILAHPPYVPALRTTQLFRDGGEDGEWLTRRVVEGLPTCLYPGGRLYLVAMLAEYPDEAIAHRVRGWLRDAGPEFDMVVVLRRACDAATFFFDNCAPDDLPAWRQFLDQRRIRRFRYTNIIIERHRESVAPLTVVREAGDGFTMAHAEAVLPLVRRLDDEEWLMATRPKAVAAIECTTRRRLRERAWLDEGRTVSANGPFRVQTGVPDWAPEFLARCDGTRTVAELGHADFVRELLADGLLEAE
ncbi:MAG TPA: methyltransferase [Candidatus Sulfopaludibacter sp.]|nr:methyltransferase [Candidatus Sulfopaludibacter sp.]